MRCAGGSVTSLLPSFTLHSAGLLLDGFWRQYELRAGGLTCLINETFDANVFGGEADEAAADAHEATADAGLYNGI